LGHRRHEREAARLRLRLAVLTVSDSRTPEGDETGKLLRERALAAGHEVPHHSLVPDEISAVRHKVTAWIAEEMDVVLVNGGTGLGPRDRTPEALQPLLDREVRGFGEAFRRVSEEDIGPAACLSRAGMGIVGSTVLAWLPGSTAAAATAWDRILVKLLPHLVWELRGRPA